MSLLEEVKKTRVKEFLGLRRFKENNDGEVRNEEGEVDLDDIGGKEDFDLCDKIVRRGGGDTVRGKGKDGKFEGVGLEPTGELEPTAPA